MPVSHDRRSQIQSIIDSLHYDFATFNISHFLHHLEIHRHRSLNVSYVALAPELFGLWSPGQSQDYVFINSTLHPAHQIHSLLHEIAHLLLGHRGVDLEQALGTSLYTALKLHSGEGHLRSSMVTADPVQETEAEVFVLLIHRRVLKANRLRELYGEVTSLQEMRWYTRALDLED